MSASWPLSHINLPDDRWQPVIEQTPNNSLFRSKSVSNVQCSRQCSRDHTIVTDHGPLSPPRMKPARQFLGSIRGFFENRFTTNSHKPYSQVSCTGSISRHPEYLLFALFSQTCLFGFGPCTTITVLDDMARTLPQPPRM
jgi:hypothetical protein